MPENSSSSTFLSRLIATGKDLVAMLRDAGLLALAVLLIGWPHTINSILVDAGFEEGSFAGLKWKANLKSSDKILVEARNTIADLTDQNAKLNKTLSDVKLQTGNAELKENISNLEQLNSQLADSAAKVQVSVDSNIAANAPLVQKIQTATGSVTTWGIVYGGDQNLESAKYEVQTIATKLGLTNAAIYYRQGSYRSVATTTDRVQAAQFLVKAKERQKDSYIVNMSSWCPNAMGKEGYFECSNS